MKETILTKAIDRYIALEMKVIDRFIKEFIEPLGDIGNPEKLIGKKYEQWTPEDLQRLGQIYGAEPNPLSHLIVGKEYNKVKALEAEVK